MKVTLTDTLEVAIRDRHDCCIMNNEYLTRYTPTQKLDINLVRMHLQIIMLSDASMESMHATTTEKVFDAHNRSSEQKHGHAKTLQHHPNKKSGPTTSLPITSDTTTSGETLCGIFLYLRYLALLLRQLESTQPSNYFSRAYPNGTGASSSTWNNLPPIKQYINPSMLAGNLP